MLTRHAIFLALAATALLASACGSHASEVRAPFATTPFTEAGGPAVLGVGPAGVTLRFVPSTAFGIGIVLRNRTGRRITLLDVAAPSLPTALVRQVGTELRRWSPPKCSGSHSCPAYGFLHAPYGAVHAAPVSIGPRAEAAVQLDFRLQACSAVPLATAGAPDRIEVGYRVGDGSIRLQTLELGSSRLRLRMPSRRDCLPRPASMITVEGQYATGSDWTIPQSAGDDCTITPAGGLAFESRVYQAPRRPAVRVSIRLLRFRGAGLYRSLPGAASALGPARVTVGVGSRGLRSTSAVVSVTRRTATTIGGRFHATIAGPHHSMFRAFGAWRCELE